MGDSSKRLDLKEMMRRQFFGDPNHPDCVGLAEQLDGGVGPFAGLYTSETALVTDEERCPRAPSSTPAGNSY